MLINTIKRRNLYNFVQQSLLNTKQSAVLAGFAKRHFMFGFDDNKNETDEPMQTERLHK